MAVLRRQSDKIELLETVPLFSNLTKKQLAEVARHTDELHLERGKALTRQGEAGNEMFVIVEGAATVRRDGKLLSQRGPGDFIGEMSLLDGHPRSATVTTDEDTVVLVMHRNDFSQLLDDVPGLTRRVLAGLSQRVRELDARVAS